MKKTLIALTLLLPAMAMAQQKYTNDDLDSAPSRDAYTNADLQKLAPLPVQGAPAAAMEAMPAPMVDRVAEDRARQRAAMMFDRDMIEAEIGYWQDVLGDAHRGMGSLNDYPRVGRDTAEARGRIIRLERQIFLLDEEMSRLR